MLDESARLYGLAGPQDFAAQQPAGRLLDPAEIAAVLAFLAGPESSGDDRSGGAGRRRPGAVIRVMAARAAQ